MPLQEHHVAGKGVDTGIERGERSQRAEDEMAIMDHAVRVAIGLRLERLVRLCLMPGTTVGDALLMGPRRDHRDQRQDQQQ